VLGGSGVGVKGFAGASAGGVAGGVAGAGVLAGFCGTTRERYSSSPAFSFSAALVGAGAVD
jgi:hypothetical protein